MAEFGMTESHVVISSVGVQGPKGYSGIEAGPNPPSDTNVLWADTDDNFAVVAGSPISGTGYPEGAVAAPVGQRYIDVAATNGAVEWIKASGSGSTGWKVTYGDTGWRDISSYLNPEDWDTTKPQSTSNYFVWRRTAHDEVELAFRLTLHESFIGRTRAAGAPLLTLDSNLGTVRWAYRAHGIATIGSGVLTRMAHISNAATGGRLDFGPTSATGNYVSGSDLVIGGTARYVTSSAWPTTLPGVAV